MRLLFLTQDFPPDVGGTQTYAFELARRFAPRCDDFAVLAPHVPGCETSDAQWPFDVHRIRASYNTFSFMALPALLPLIRVRRFDASFHVQWPSALSALVARRMGRLRRVFLAAHGRELLLDPLPFPLSSLYGGLRRRVLTNADRLFPVSRYTGALLERVGVPDRRISVVNNGTDAKRFSPADVSTFCRRIGVEHRRVVLTVSRLVPRKGIDTVIRALPQVAKAVPGIVFLIGGTGPERPRLEALAKSLGVSGFIRFLGRIANDELALYYNACDVFTMPSREEIPNVEGFGIVFLEANACGKPVVAAHTGGIPDAVRDGETGLLVPPDDPEALAEALVRLLKAPDYAARLGRNGRERVLREATWDHIADRIFDAMVAGTPGFSNASL